MSALALETRCSIELLCSAAEPWGLVLRVSLPFHASSGPAGALQYFYTPEDGSGTSRLLFIWL